MVGSLVRILRRIAARPSSFGMAQSKIASTEELAACLAGHARFVAQKCVVEYLRLRAGLRWEQLHQDPVFRTGIERCRRETFVRLLGDVAELAEMVLRGSGGRLDVIEAVVPPAVAAALADPAQVPPGIDAAEAAAGIAARLARRRLAPPRPLRRVGAGTARHMLGLLTFDERLLAADLDYVQNNVCFSLAQVHEKLRQQMDCDALVRGD